MELSSHVEAGVGAGGTDWGHRSDWSIVLELSKDTETISSCCDSRSNGCEGDVEGVDPSSKLGILTVDHPCGVHVEGSISIGAIASTIITIVGEGEVAGHGVGGVIGG